MAIFDSKVATQFRQEILSFEKSVMVNLTQLLKLLLKATSCAKSENQSNCIKRLSLRLFLIPCSCPTIAVIAKLLIKLKFDKIKNWLTCPDQEYAFHFLFSTKLLLSKYFLSFPHPCSTITVIVIF